MAEITPERQQQLTEEYAELKEKILDVDHKYSLSYYEPELEFEPSLGLEKLTFTPLTETELQQLAQQEVNPRYLEKQRSLDKSYATAKANVLLSVDRQAEKHRKNLVKLADQYAEDYKKRQHALANGGMWHSSAAEKALKSIDDAYDGDVEEENKRYTAEYEALYDKLDALEDSYEQGTASIAQQKQLAIAAEVAALEEKQEKNRISIEKYNNTVDEKEIKYQASCRRYLQYAVQAEYERALEAAKLHAELGESGVKQQMLSEKLNCCKAHFTGYRQYEAQFVLQIDTFLQANLEDYYTALTDWVTQILIP